eukprot:4012476-Amphidinium_carterae.2
MRKESNLLSIRLKRFHTTLPQQNGLNKKPRQWQTKHLAGSCCAAVQQQPPPRQVLATQREGRPATMQTHLGNP